MVVVLRHVDKSRQTLAEPHCDLSIHVDGKWLESLLQAAHGVVLKGASILPEVHTTHLRQTEATHWNKPCRTDKGHKDKGGGSKGGGEKEVFKNTRQEGWNINAAFAKGNLQVALQIRLISTQGAAQF